MKKLKTSPILYLCLVLLGSSFAEAAPSEIWEYKVLGMAQIMNDAMSVDPTSETGTSEASNLKRNSESKNPLFGIQATFENIAIPTFEKTLNTLGADRWELSATTENYLIFKRTKR